jgi:hypothetical protein
MKLDFRSLSKHGLIGCRSRAEEIRIGRRLKRLVFRRMMDLQRERKEFDHAS